MKKVELRELEVLGVRGSTSTVEVRASYVIPADRGRGRQFGAQVFTCRLRKDDGLVRIQGRDGPFGHYDANQGKWFPTDVVRQGIFSDVIEAVIAAARKELQEQD